MIDDFFERSRAMFDLPKGVVYLDGNSLGAMPKSARERVRRELDESWGRELIRAWNTAGWIDLPSKVGDRIGTLVGARKGSVVAGDSTSINLFKALTAALDLARPRKVILSDSGNFPTDLYVAQGVCHLLGRGYELKIVDPEAVESTLDERVAVLMLTEVDYRTGRKHSMRELTEKAKALGIVTIWDLAHSAGALPVDVTGCRTDFAVGCGYKYLNGGPGAPAFIYVRPDLQERIAPALSGWMGHAAPFAFELKYRPAPAIDRLRAGTPPVLSMAALDAALDVFESVDMLALRKRSVALGEDFIRRIEADCPELQLASPRDPERRGSQVSFRFAEGYATMQALIARGVIGDFREPDVMRFGFTPLYIGFAEVETAARTLVEIVRGGLWDRPEFHARNKVT
ncbi:MAG TPA: kynureninase [Roseiarcus sp.]